VHSRGCVVVDLERPRERELGVSGVSSVSFRIQLIQLDRAVSP
jgi:hypothetical protein